MWWAPRACLAIAGPGSTNLLTGLYDAELDAGMARMLAATGPYLLHILQGGELV